MLLCSSFQFDNKAYIMIVQIISQASFLCRFLVVQQITIKNILIPAFDSFQVKKNALLVT